MSGVVAVVLDWAGTAVDHGSMAPAGVFVEVFRRHDVAVTQAQAREPMGVHKREHVRQMCAMPAVRAAWAAVHGEPPSAAREDALYIEAAALQIEVLRDHAQPIAGVPALVDVLRGRGIKVGGTTGYTREMLDVLEVEAAARGYAPDASVAASEVARGRPAPFLMWECLHRLGVWPAHAAVKVGDTPVDMQAGRNAGAWAVGLALTGNETGLTAEGLAALSESERATLRERADRRLREAGAHFVIDGAADLLPVLERIEARLRQGERP